MSRDLPAWGISLVVNLSVLAVLHFIVYERQREQEVTITSIVEDQQFEEELRFSEATSTDTIGTEGDANSLTPTLKSATAVGTNDAPLQEKVEEFLNPDIPQLSETSMVKLEGDIAEVVEVKGTGEVVPGGVEGAMDRITYEIRRSLEERKTLVIWALDASTSLADRRKAVADRFDNVYKQLGKMGDTSALYSVVVTYGKGAQLLTDEPLQDVQKLSEIVRTGVKEDSSGVENVFGALKLALEKFRGFRRSEGAWNKLVFIVTDERGDDADQYLEDVIALSKRSLARVYTVGNAAIFGQKHGYIRYTWKEGDQEFTRDLPLDQGPESAFPQAIQLPFIGSGSDWKLRQMSASYGPYALTRLCAETGGMYLITEESRGYSFDRAVMRSYTPDYTPVRVQEQEIKRNAAKAALVNAAGLSYDDTLPVPQLVFRGYNDTLLRQEITEAQRPAAEVDYKLRRMYETLVVGEKARETLAEPRWRAAFDLAMGRVLAMRVRYFGYNQMLANMKVNIKTFEKADSNMWRLSPSDEIATGPQMREAAEKAKEYLRRVITEHPGTPWAMLAERELATELGWTWQEFHQDIPSMEGRSRLNDEEVARLLLAEEEQRRMSSPQGPSGPKSIPKL